MLDVLLAVWDGMSNGTDHMVKTMKSLNKQVIIYDLKTGKQSL
jgi:hypothetical protein